METTEAGSGKVPDVITPDYIKTQESILKDFIDSIEELKKKKGLTMRQNKTLICLKGKYNDGLVLLGSLYRERSKRNFF